MQIIYAAPFLFLSVSAFCIFLGFPALRRMALPALVAPVAFGVCSLAGWVVFALLDWHFLHFHSNARSLLAIEGLVFYLFPGLLGAWLCIRAVRFFERRFLASRHAQDLAIRLGITFISCGAGFVAGLAVAEQLLAPGSVYPAFITALVSAGVLAVLAFIVVMYAQRRAVRRTAAVQN